MLLSLLFALSACSSSDYTPCLDGDDQNGMPGLDGWAGSLEDASTAQGVENPILEFEGTAPTNLLVISIDTLRRDRIGHYSGADTSPFLDSILAESVVFEDHRSCANWTFPSMVCALSGMQPWDLGLNVVAREQPAPLPESVDLLGDYLRDAGYFTSMVSTNHFLADEYGFGKGYDSLDLIHGATADELLDVAETTLDDLGEDPWYLQLHFLDPHADYVAPEEYLVGEELLGPIEYDVSRWEVLNGLLNDWDALSKEEQILIETYTNLYYDAEVRFLDAQIRLLWQDLEARGLLDDTLVLFMSDHGEQFFEHDGITHPYDLYSEETSGLAAFWSSDLSTRSYEGATSHTDFLPTILDALSIDVPAGLTGRVIETDSELEPRFAAVLQGEFTAQSVDFDGWRLIYHWENGDRELYNLVQDPDESMDLGDYEDTRVDLLWDLLTPQVDQITSQYRDAMPVKPERE